MTDKRFTVGKKNNKWYIKDNWEDIRYNDMTLPNDILKVCMILNELHEENNEFKCESKMVYERNTYKKLYDEVKQENKQLKQYKKAIWNWDSSKIIRVNMNTGEVDLVDKVLEE